MQPELKQHKHYPPKASRGDSPSVLTSIYEDEVNIAIWQRENKESIDRYAHMWASQQPAHSPRVLLSMKGKLSEQLDSLLPEIEGKDEFQQEVELLVDMFACLFDAEEVGLRLTPLSKAMCPRFHVDNIPCRLITTYAGLGTEWLLEDNLDRRRLGRGANGLADHESGIFSDAEQIQQLQSQHVALLKGSGWIGNEEHALVHRSPCISPPQTRLLLTLDYV